jgi:hypothetical protein
MYSDIIQIEMTTRRFLLRYPALLGVVLLLLSGVREAYGFGTCPMGHPGGESAASEVRAESGEGHAHHSGNSGDSNDQGDGCECRLLCLSVPVPTPPEPTVLSFDPVLPHEPSTAPAIEDPDLLPNLHLPYLLPFSNAPPAFS